MRVVHGGVHECVTRVRGGDAWYINATIYIYSLSDPPWPLAVGDHPLELFVLFFFTFFLLHAICYCIWCMYMCIAIQSDTHERIWLFHHHTLRCVCVCIYVYNMYECMNIYISTMSYVTERRRRVPPRCLALQSKAGREYHQLHIYLWYV